jgi:hypothetical protein
VRGPSAKTASRLFLTLVALALGPGAAQAQRLLFVSNDGSTAPALSVFTIGAAGHLGAVSGSPFSIPGGCCGADGVAVTPNGRFVYVTNWQGTVAGFSVATDGSLTALPGSPYPAGSLPVGLAITPNGRYLYATDHGAPDVYAFAIANDGVLSRVGGSPFALGSGQSGAGKPAIATSGKSLYVPDSQGVVAFTIGSGGALAAAPGSPYPIAGNLGPTSAGVTPNGRELLVALGAHQVAAYAIAAGGSLKAVTGSPFNATPTTAGLSDMAVSPTGRWLYTVGGSQLGGMEIAANGRLSSLPGSPYPYPAASPVPQALAVGPGGSEVFASDPSISAVAPFQVRMNGSLAPIGAPVPTGSSAPDQFGVAVAPEQSPVASFLTHTGRSGKPTTLNAAASKASNGDVAQYVWSFGDGHSAATTSPTFAHTYRRSGKYKVSLTVIDAFGCSDALIFTGQTLSCNGSARARTTRSVVVSGPASAVTLAAIRARATAVTLRGLVTANGKPTHYYFQYGPHKSYGHRTKTRSVSRGAVRKLVTVRITGLTRGQVYHFRLVAANQLGRGHGADRKVKTRT